MSKDNITSLEDVKKSSTGRKKKQDTGNQIPKTDTEYLNNLVNKAAEQADGNEEKKDILNALIDEDKQKEIEAEDENIKTRSGGGTNRIQAYMDSLTEEEQRAIRRKGGLVSGAKRKARKTLAETLTAILEQGDNQDKLCMSLFQTALMGDVKAFNSLRDTIGEMPTQKTEVTAVTQADIALVEKVSKRLECSPEKDKQSTKPDVVDN